MCGIANTIVMERVSKMKKRVAAYYRISTADRQTVETQRRAVRDFVSRHDGWQVTAEFQDVGVSGVVHDREGLDDLKEACVKGKVDIVVTFRFDRIARSVTHLLETLELLRQHKVGFVSLCEAIDTTTSLGKFVFVVIAAISEFEREILKQRVCAGLARAKANGVRLGRPRKGFDVQRALELRQQGWGYRAVARELGVSPSTLHANLRNVPTTAGVQNTPVGE